MILLRWQMIQTSSRDKFYHYFTTRRHLHNILPGEWWHQKTEFFRKTNQNFDSHEEVELRFDDLLWVQRQ